MKEIINSGLLCPIRITDEGIETLLTRRAFWNYQKDRPMMYPSEWLYAGGSYDEEVDRNLLETAQREFREEKKYDGPITDTIFLCSATQDTHGKTYNMEFYTARIDSDCPLKITDYEEIIDAKWMLVDDAIELIYSEDFTKEQTNEFKTKKLDNPKYEKYAVTERQYPIQNINALKLIRDKTPELMELYKT